MSAIRLFVAMFFCVSVTWALPKRPVSNDASSGMGEIHDELPPDYHPFDPLNKRFPNNEVYNDNDLDPEGNEYDVNDIDPYAHPQGGASERPIKPDDRIPEKEYPKEKPKEDEEDHEPPSHEKPKEGEETDDEEDHKPPSHEKPKEGEETEDEEGETETQEGEEKTRGNEEEDTHTVQDEERLHGDEEETTQEADKDAPLPFNTALFNFQQVNHYIKQLEKAMEHVFKETLEEAALLNNTFANTTEEEVEVDGHKYKVQKSLIKTRDDDNNSTLLIEAVSSVSEDEPKKKRKERSNPDAEPIQ